MSTPDDGDNQELAVLLRQLTAPESSIRCQAASALGKARDTRAVDPLIAALSDPDPEVRKQAIWALSEIGDVRAAEPIIERFLDPDSHVGHVAAAYPPPYFFEHALSHLLELLAAHDDEHTRWLVANALHYVKHPTATATLIALLQDPNEETRIHAAAGLGATGGADAVLPLVAALRDESWGVREMAALALGDLADPRAVEPLIGALSDEKSTSARPPFTAWGSLPIPMSLKHCSPHSKIQSVPFDRTPPMRWAIMAIQRRRTRWWRPSTTRTFTSARQRPSAWAG